MCTLQAYFLRSTTPTIFRHHSPGSGAVVSFSLDFSMHRIKPLVLVSSSPEDFGYWRELHMSCEKIAILLFNFQQMEKQWVFKSKICEKAQAVFSSLEQKLHNLTEIRWHFQIFYGISSDVNLPKIFWNEHWTSIENTNKQTSGTTFYVVIFL